MLRKTIVPATLALISATLALIPATLALLLFGACGTHASTDTTTARTVWVSGNVNDGARSKACYWKNGLINLLAPEINVFENSFAESIWVEKGDVYIAGFTPLGATLWKNGKPERIGNVLLALATVGVSNGDVYVTANELDSTGSPQQDGYLWKNGRLTALPAPFGKASAARLAVDGTDVYITGTLNKDTARKGQYAVCWKNGVATVLSSDTSTADGIAVANGDVYIAGTLTGTQKTSALYWKNGVAVALPSDSINSSATLIGLLKNDVFVAGEAFNRRLQIYNAVYWYKGVQHYLTAPDIESSANCLAVYHGDIYIGGVIARPNASDGNKWQACYWKNGVLTTLDWPGWKGNGYVTGIFVSGEGE